MKGRSTKDTNALGAQHTLKGRSFSAEAFLNDKIFIFFLQIRK